VLSPGSGLRHSKGVALEIEDSALVAHVQEAPLQEHDVQRGDSRYVFQHDIVREQLLHHAQKRENSHSLEGHNIMVIFHDQK
jgi:hypothetical protein